MSPLKNSTSLFISECSKRLCIKKGFINLTKKWLIYFLGRFFCLVTTLNELLFRFPRNCHPASSNYDQNLCILLSLLQQQHIFFSDIVNTIFYSS